MPLPEPVSAPRATSYTPPPVMPTSDEELIHHMGAPFVVRGGTAFPVDESWSMRAVHVKDEQQAPIGSSGKRHSRMEPLTEHDIAEKIARASLRLTQLLMEADSLGMKPLVQKSRFLPSGTFEMVQEEVSRWT